MGCSHSKFPNFVEKSIAANVFPTPNTPEGYESITYVPQEGIFPSPFGVFLPNDALQPTYYFALVGSKCKLFKLINTEQNNRKANDLQKEEVAYTEEGMPSSQPNNEMSSDIRDDQNRSFHAQSKKINVVCNLNSIQTNVTINKNYQTVSKGLLGFLVTISHGFTVNAVAFHSKKYVCHELRKNNAVVALFFDGTPSMIEEVCIEGDTMLHWLDLEKMRMAKAPCGMYIKSSLSEEEKIQIIAIVAALNDRLVGLL